MHKAAKEKVSRLVKQRSEGGAIKRKHETMAIEAEMRSQQHSKTFYAKRQGGNDFYVNPYIGERIIAFIKGWKIRKIMKCREIADIIKR